jgi:hypothetical protein
MSFKLKLTEICRSRSWLRINSAVQLAAVGFAITCKNDVCIAWVESAMKGVKCGSAYELELDWNLKELVGPDPGTGKDWVIFANTIRIRVDIWVILYILIQIQVKNN